MNFELVRIGWPNTVAIAALAMVPIVSVAAVPQRITPASYTVDAATICPTSQDGSLALATLLPDASIE
jgi:hypothetical protein